MIYLSDEAQKIVMQDGKRKIVNIYWEDETIPNISNSKIKQESLSFTESLDSSGNFKFGGGELCVLEFTAYDLPNVKDKIFNAEIMIELGADYEGATDNTVVMDGVRYAQLSLGTYKVDSCKKEVSMGGLNARKIQAYSNDTLNPKIVKQLDNLWTSQYNYSENMFINTSNLLLMNDSFARDVGWQTVNRGALTEVALSYEPKLGTYNSNSYYLRFSVSYHNAWLQALRNGICKIEKTRNFKDYNSDSTKTAVRTAIYNLCTGISSYLSNISSVVARLENMLDEVQSYIAYDEPLYFFGFSSDFDAIYGRNYHYDAMPWVSMKIELLKDTTVTGTQTVKFLEEEALGGDNLSLYSITYSGLNMPINMSLNIKKPEINTYDAWMRDYRKSLYELSALFSSARNNFKARRVTSNGLYPSVGLTPKEGLYPSKGYWLPDKVYVESEHIKQLDVDESRVKFKRIEFEWNDFTGEQQTFTWNMPKDITKLNNVRSKNIGFKKQLSSDKKTITITFEEEITNTVMMIYNLSLNASFGADFLIADAYSGDELLFTLARSDMRKGGIIDTNTTSIGQHTFTSRNILPSELSGKICNDKCVGMNKIVIRANNGVDLQDNMFSLSNIYDYVRPSGAAYKVDYIEEGEIYYLDSNNLIMSDGNLDGFEIMYFVDKLDTALRLIDYVPLDADIKGMPFMEAGDIAEFHAPFQNAKTVVMRRTMQGIQNLMDNIESN